MTLVLLLIVVLIRLATQLDGGRGQFLSVVIRGGGFVNGLVVAGDRMYARTDIGGAYRFNPATTQWEQMISTSSVTVGRHESDYQVQALGASPSDPSTVYALVGATEADSLGARMLRSNDAGAHWAASQTAWYVGGDEDRRSGARIAVDPSNSGVLYVGTRRDGLMLSRDGGQTWESAMPPTALDTSSPAYGIGVTAIAVDPMSPIAEGRHSVVWAGVAGVGLMRSIDGGRTWSLASEFREGFVSDIALAAGGTLAATLYSMTDGMRSRVIRVDASGGVADITPSAEGRWVTVAGDPSRPGTLVVGSESVVDGVGIYATRDGEAPMPHWLPVLSSIADGNDGTTWPTRSNVFDYLQMGQIRFNGGELWFAEGVGAWRSSSDFGTSLQWRFASDGIEEFVGNSLYKPVGAPLLTAEWDRGLMRHPDPTNRDPVAGAEAQFPYTTHFGSAWDVSASPSDPKFLVAVLDDHQDLTGRTSPERRASGYTTDGGATWNRFVALQDGTAPQDLMFGNIAVSAQDNTNLVWAPSNLAGFDTKIYFSRNLGATWQSGRLHGLDAMQFLHHRYVQARKILVSDPKTPGVFYALGSNEDGAAIVWKSADGGANWGVVWGSGPAPAGSNGFRYDSTLVAADGYLVAAPGRRGGCLLRSRDGYQWETICTLEGALGMGIGAPVEEGQQNVTLYSYGDVGGNVGVYRSTDLGSQWTRLSGDPAGMYMGIRAISGDPEVPGRVYIALNGGGFLVGQF